MKKIIIPILAALTAFSASALEYNGLLSESTNIKIDASTPSKFSQSETLNLSLKQPISSNSYFVAEASFTHELDVFLKESTSENAFIPDLELLKLNLFFPLSSSTNLRLAAGRFNISDSTQKILSQNIDGILLNYSSPFIESSVYAGYTGLLNANNITILDSNNQQKEIINPIYSLAEKYVACGINVSLPYVLFNQTVSVEGLGVIPVNEEDKLRCYGTLLLNGALTPSLFYSLNTTIETVSFNSIANLSSLNLTVILPAIKGFAGFNAVYASGNNGSLKSFSALTKKAADLSSNDPCYSGITKFSANASSVITKNISVTGEAAGVFSNETELKFKGVQASATVLWQLFTDVQLSLNANGFFSPLNEFNRQDITVSAKIAF